MMEKSGNAETVAYLAEKAIVLHRQIASIMEGSSKLATLPYWLSWIDRAVLD
jgi:hypothetical protein